MTTNSKPSLTVDGYTPYAQVPKWVIRSGGKLSHGAVRLYATIMTYADNSDKAAFPGRSALAADMGVKEWSISKYIKELEEYGALKVERRRNKKTGNYYANRYVLAFTDPCVKKPTPREVENHTLPKPTIRTKPTNDSFTSDSSSDRGSFTPKQSSGRHAPKYFDDHTRAVLRTKLQSVGESIAEGHPFFSDHTQGLWDDFCHHLEDVIHDAEGVDVDVVLDNVWNRKWSVSAEVADPYLAGAELNKILAAKFAH